MILFSAAIVVKGLAEPRPDTLALIASMVAIFVAVIVMGWMFSIKRER